MANSRSSRPSPARPKRYGSETPRVFTPPLRKLTAKTSLGFAVIEFTETVLEMVLFPWQRWLLIHMLELLPDNSLRFRTVIVLVARQNGKSTLSQVLALWFMYVYGVRLVLGTAQDLDTAEEVWQGAVDLVVELDEDDQPVRPELYALHDKVVMVNGKKSLNLKSGERYKVKAANRRAGRGLSGDLVLLDELREHQSWDAWGAITKTTMARANALVLALSNAGDASSIVLRYLRTMAIKSLIETGGHDELGAEIDGGYDRIVEDEFERYVAEGVDDAEEYANDDTVGLFEWSAPPGCAVDDRDGWAAANPSLGYTITERTIASACRTDPEWIFRTEVLCQWNSGAIDGPFPAGAWEASTDPMSALGTPGGDVTVCVDVSADRSTAYIGFGGWRSDEAAHVEVVAQRAGTEWVVPWLVERKARITAVAVQEKGAPASELADDIIEAGLPFVPWGGSELIAGTGKFYDAVTASPPRIYHRPQPVLDVVAATAVTKPLGDGGWVWNRSKSPHDAAPMICVNGAWWLLAAGPAPTESAYEESDLIVI